MTSWLHRMREIPEYVEIYGDPLNRIVHAERAVKRVDAWENEIDACMANFPEIMDD